MKIGHVRAAAGLVALIAFAACGVEGKDTAGSTAGATTGEGAGAGTPPSAGGAVHTVEMITDPADGSNKYVPADLTVKQGDVIRYVLKTGVHNVNFLPDSNAGKSGLP